MAPKSDHTTVRTGSDSGYTLTEYSDGSFKVTRFQGNYRDSATYDKHGDNLDRHSHKNDGRDSPYGWGKMPWKGLWG